MANAPTVQTLNQLMAELTPGYEGQKNVIGQQIANTDATYKASELALDAAKTQGFNQINTQATGKGATFSGIPADEMATYLSTKYLPGVQEAKAKKQADTLTLQGQLAAIDTDIRNRALSTRDTQQSALNAWNLQQAQLEAQARENAANRAAQAAEGRANRAASAPKAADKTQLVLGLLKEGMGGDGYVSPGTFNLARDVWVANGGTYKSFTDTYWRYTGASSQEHKNTDRYKAYL